MDTAKTVPAQEPWNTPDAVSLDTYTFSEFIQRHCNST